MARVELHVKRTAVVIVHTDPNAEHPIERVDFGAWGIDDAEAPKSNCADEVDAIDILRDRRWWLRD